MLLQGFNENMSFPEARDLYYAARSKLVRTVCDKEKTYLVEEILAFDKKTKKVSVGKAHAIASCL